MSNRPPNTPGGPVSTGHYAFNAEENETIALAGTRAKIWGFVALGTGAAALIGLVVALLFKDELISHGLAGNFVTTFVVALVPVVLTHLVISMLYIGAGKSLEAVVHTQGNGIEQLMRSLHKLGTAFLVEFAIGMLAVVVSAGLGFQMAVDNLADQQATELTRAESAGASERTPP
jgi:small-conductance mechanosensitive channel